MTQSFTGVPDVVGIGALNTDLILAGAPARAVMTRVRTVLARALPPGSEHALDVDEMRQVLTEVGPRAPRTLLGGSAWNTIYALARLRTTTLGYVGVAGRTLRPAASIVDQLDAAGVDRRYVKVDGAALSGTCVSLQPSSERILLTHAGANAGMARFLDGAFSQIVTYLAGARAVHVTSFLDADSPQRLSAVLRAAKEENPNILISLDPGDVWATAPTPAIHDIVALADVLLLNDREFAALAPHHAATEPDEVLAHRLVERSDAVVVVKRSDGVRMYQRTAGGGLDASFYPALRLPTTQIRDDTGAGDVFAAGLLAGLLSAAGAEHGIRLGMALARHKLQHVGTSGHAGFQAVVAELSNEDPSGREQRGGHGSTSVAASRGAGSVQAVGTDDGFGHGCPPIVRRRGQQ
jgi:sugar/nucleoside kinase (ribokinase family)